MRLFRDVLLQFLVLTVIYKSVNAATKIDENENPENESKWYRIYLQPPLFIIYHSRYSLSLVFQVLFLIGLVVFTMLPYESLAVSQSCIISGLGTFFFANHLLVKPLLIIPGMPLIILWIICCLLAIVGAIFSVNEKFSNLFLSIGGGYIVSSLALSLFGFKYYLFYLFTFVLCFVGFVMLKKSNKDLHESIIKSLVLSFTILAIIDLITPLRFFMSIYINAIRIGKLIRLLGYALFAFIFGVLYMYSANIKKIHEFFKK